MPKLKHSILAAALFLLLAPPALAAANCPTSASGVDCSPKYLMGGTCVDKATADGWYADCQSRYTASSVLDCDSSTQKCVCGGTYEPDPFNAGACRLKCPGGQLYCSPPSSGGTRSDASAPASCVAYDYGDAAGVQATDATAGSCKLQGFTVKNYCTGECNSCPSGTVRYNGKCLTPAALVFDTAVTPGAFMGQTDAGWNDMTGVWSKSGNDIYNNNTGKVGIGTSSPQAPLHIHSTSTTSKIQLTNSTSGSASANGGEVNMVDKKMTVMNKENSELYFGTNNVSQMTLTRAGNLGIGNANVDTYTGTKFWSYGSVKIGSSTAFTTDLSLQMDSKAGAWMQIGADWDNSSTTENAFLYITQDNGAADSVLGVVGAAGKNPYAAYGDGNLTDTLQQATVLAALDNKALQLGTNKAVRMTILGGGNVGIGTPSPTAKLEINMANPNGWSGNLKANRIMSPDNNYYMDLITYVIGGGNVGYHFSPNGNTGLIISTPGNVGIGVAPGEKLDVSGNIRASGQLKSTIATGTAPLAVSSTTKVTNLNVDYLDGHDTSYFATATHNHSGVYQPVGSYSLTTHNHSGVYATVGHVHNRNGCDWTDWFSEEDTYWRYCGSNQFVNGFACSGSNCDDVMIYCCYF